VKIRTWAVAVAFGVAGGTLTLAGPAQADLAGDIASLTVAAEADRAGYDRDLFGDPDRDAVLAAGEQACGFYSAADDQCYADAGEVDVDHIVALAEAWDSGADGWTAAQRDEFGSTAANLWLMTDNLNASKGDDDAAEWLPPHGPAACGYVTVYVQVKTEWSLTVDEAELAALGDAAATCTLAAPADPEPPECVDVNAADAETLQMLRHVGPDRAAQIIALRPFSSVDDLGRVNGLAAGGVRLAELVAGGDGFLPLCVIAAAPGGDDDGSNDGEAGGLPVTGAALPLLLTGGSLAAVVGGGLYLAARRRRVRFTT
jgi:hypothetical protein